MQQIKNSRKQPPKDRVVEFQWDNSCRWSCLLTLNGQFRISVDMYHHAFIGAVYYVIMFVTSSIHRPAYTARLFRLHYFLQVCKWWDAYWKC